MCWPHICLDIVIDYDLISVYRDMIYLFGSRDDLVISVGVQWVFKYGTVGWWLNPGYEECERQFWIIIPWLSCLKGGKAKQVSNQRGGRFTTQISTHAFKSGRRNCSAVSGQSSKRPKSAWFLREQSIYYMLRNGRTSVAISTAIAATPGRVVGGCSTAAFCWVSPKNCKPQGQKGEAIQLWQLWVVPKDRCNMDLKSGHCKL